MTDCIHAIKNGFIFRSLVTLISFVTIYMNNNNSFIKQYLIIIIIILLFVFDELDQAFLIKDKLTNAPADRCSRLFNYQYKDKINDIISYILIFILFFNKNYIILFLILYRIIGVTLFSIKKDSKWLIIFFDFIKEYLLYFFLFGNNYTYIPVAIILKVAFEYYHHTINNLNNYK